MAFKDIAVAWINTDKNGEKYLGVTILEDMKAGDKLFLRKNTFKKPGEKSPDYRYSVRVQDGEVGTDEDIEDQIPF